MSTNHKSVMEAPALDPLQRFALAYAPGRARALWYGLLALDTRLAEAAHPGREPFAVQLRLAWWRDRLAGPAAGWPAGEPLLALLRPWDGERGVLSALVDGWEELAVGGWESAGAAQDSGATLRMARIDAMAALARLLGCGGEDAVRAAARDWTAPGAAGAMVRLPRDMRPLAVLRGLALREAAGRPRRPVRDLLAGMRIGLTGR